MEQIDREIIESLSEPAKRVFKSLDYRSQQRMLMKAKEMAKKKKVKKHQKGYIKKRDIGKRENRKKQDRQRGGLSKGQAASFIARGYKERAIESMYLLLLGSRMSEETGEGKYGGHFEDESGAISNEAVRKTTRTVSGGMKVLMKRNLQKRLQSKAVQKSAQSVKKGAKSATRVEQFLVKTIRTVVQSIATNPIAWIAILVVIVLALIVGVIGAIIGSGGAANETENYTYQANVSEQTESYRELVSKYCEKYEIDDYVDLCLAMIEQESGGKEPDVMQTEQSYYNKNPPIDNAEESIDCGTHELSDCLTKAKCKSANDIKGISLALQGYNCVTRS